MENAGPYIKIFVNDAKQVQLETNITDTAQINLYLDYVKQQVLARAFAGPKAVVEAGVEALASLSNGKAVPIR